MHDAGQLELERAARMLEAAHTRLRRTATAAHTIVAGLTGDDGQLVCLIEASSLETARRLVCMALLPTGRIREITHVTSRLTADSQISQAEPTRGDYPGVDTQEAI